MKKFIIPATMILLFLVYRVISSNNSWLDIGINDPLINHTINITHGKIEIVPWDTIIDTGGTVAVILVILYIAIVGGKNFIKGLHGESSINEKDKEIVGNNTHISESECEKKIDLRMPKWKYYKMRFKEIMIVSSVVIIWGAGAFIFGKMFSFLGGYTDGDGFHSFSAIIYTVITIIGLFYYQYKWRIRQERKNK